MVMIKKLFNGLCTFLAALLISYPAFADEIPQTQLSEPMVATPVAPPPFWEGLDGRASLVGGQYTTSRQQYDFAKGQGREFFNSETYQQKIASGELVKLEGPNIRIVVKHKNPTIPYVLVGTRDFIVSLSNDRALAGCGPTIVTDALRLLDRAVPSNASMFSLHYAGMAVDLRVTDLSPECESWMNTYLLDKEAKMVVDATREHWKMVDGIKVPNHHFHLVVPSTQAPQTVQLAANP